jgi:putative tryptophan/tyrosine transport system substrate-binding protein
MRLIGLAVVLAVGLVLSPLAAEGQQGGKTVRIGLLDFASPDPARVTWWTAFRERLRELGYVEGQNIAFEPRWGNGHVSGLPSLAAELLRTRVDILVTAGSEAALAAKRATGSIPIVMTTGVDPVGLGLVASLARPGGNVTGVTSIQSELAGKRVEILKECIPRAGRIAILWDSGNHGSALVEHDAKSAATSMGIAVQSIAVRSPSEFDAAFAAMKRARAEAVILVASPPFIGDRRRIADLALTHRLPMMVGAKEYAEAGGLLSYATDYPDLFRQAATYVDKIFKGAKPADLPVEQPTKFELVINLKTAKALGLTIPPSVLGRADQIIE